MSYRSLYAAFDRHPSPKGASVHIAHMAQTLFEVQPPGLLCVLGEPTPKCNSLATEASVRQILADGSNLIDRALSFGNQLGELVADHSDTLRLVHFRDPWSGVPTLLNPRRNYRTIFEINGLPSLELPTAYPTVGRATLDKIREAEAFCWLTADRIITPAHSLKQNLVGLGVPADKITVLPNGAHIRPTPPRPTDAPSVYLLYFGALQPWQGVDVLLRAFARLGDWPDLRLVICSSVSQKAAQPYRRLASSLGIEARVIWQYQLSEQALAPWRAHATLTIAPLTDCARNVQQGCCPLKILESMADGVPVIASNLPSVRELITDDVHGRLIPPGRPAELARAIRVALETPDSRAAWGNAARLRVEQQFTWDQIQHNLSLLYNDILSLHWNGTE